MRLAPATRRPWGSWWWSRSTAMPRTVHPRFRARSGTCKPMRIIVKLPQRPALKSRGAVHPALHRSHSRGPDFFEQRGLGILRYVKKRLAPARNL